MPSNIPGPPRPVGFMEWATVVVMVCAMMFATWWLGERFFRIVHDRAHVVIGDG